jgi:peptidoglycan/xylan/chitin deacetylase (PgdA/CDA1 family)
MLLGLATNVLVAASVATAQPLPRSVALTFDDLPFADAGDGPLAQAQAIAANREVQNTLRRYSAPAIGFVNETRVATLGAVGTAIVKSWNRGDFELGNHGFAHLDSNRLSLPEIEGEITAGESTIKPLVLRAGRSLRFYRFAFNHVGETEAKRIAMQQLLARHGYRLAASTIDTSDYLFARAYDRARARKDAVMQQRLEAAYLAYTRQQIGYYARLNAQVLGYEPPQVMLLHLSSLNAATLERILRIFRSLGYRFVSLAEAQSDPAYRRPPVFATKYGPMWGYRWAHERGVAVDGRAEAEPPSWVRDYAADK